MARGLCLTMIRSAKSVESRISEPPKPELIGLHSGNALTDVPKANRRTSGKHDHASLDGTSLLPLFERNDFLFPACRPRWIAWRLSNDETDRDRQGDEREQVTHDSDSVAAQCSVQCGSASTMRPWRRTWNRKN